MRNFGFLLIALNLLVSGASCVLAEVKWERISSITGRIPIPNAGDQQTCCVVGDIDGDGDLDLLVKPYNHKSPRIDVLLNQGNK